MTIREFPIKDHNHFCQIVAAMRHGAVIEAFTKIDGIRYEGTLVASHPERMSCSLLVESITHEERN